MQWILNDRRAKRSDSREKAVQLKLEHIKKIENLEAIVFTDAQGQLMSHQGSFDTCRELAALAPYYPGSLFAMSLPPNLMGGKIDVQTFYLDGETFHLAYFTAQHTDCFRASLAESTNSIKRILSLN